MPTDYDGYRMLWYGCHTRPRDPASSPPLGHAGAGTGTRAGGTPAAAAVLATGDPAKRPDPRWSLDPVRPLDPVWPFAAVRTVDPARPRGTATAGDAGRCRAAPPAGRRVARLPRARRRPGGAPAERAGRAAAADPRRPPAGHRSRPRLSGPGHRPGPA